MLTVGSLFSGIGGIDLGLQRAGMRIAWQIEIDDWCRKVLTKHWPDVPKYADIREVTGYELEPVDVLCGGFPCQSSSFAGKRKGRDDERWLWPEFARAIRSLRPRYVLVENVPGILAPIRDGDGRIVQPAPIDEVLGDLSACGYDAEWQSLSAAAVGAPHIRDRVWIVAYPQSGWRSQQQEVTHGKALECASIGAGGRTKYGHPAEGISLDRRIAPCGEAVLADLRADVSHTACLNDQRPFVFGDRSRKPKGQARNGIGFDGRQEWDTEPDVCRMVDGLSNGLDRCRDRGLGNAVVPQCVEYIGGLIVAHAQGELL